MDGCPHCENAKKALNQLINSGKVKIISPAETKDIFKDRVRGFPAFKNTANNKEIIGFRSVDDLMRDLGEVPAPSLARASVSAPNGNEADVVFFKLNNCGFCTRALQLLQDEIANGRIKVVDHTLAPKEATGFPFFMNVRNGKTHSGLPQSAAQLYEKLGVSENFRHTRKLAPQYREHYNPPKPPDHRANKYNYAAQQEKERQMKEQQMKEQQMKEHYAKQRTLRPKKQDDEPNPIVEWTFGVL